MRKTHTSAVMAALAIAAIPALVTDASADVQDVVLNAQYEYLDAYLVQPDGSYERRVFIDPDPILNEDGTTNVKARVGRHVNGQVCFFPANAPQPFRGGFVIADDTYREACVETSQRQARCDIESPTNDPTGEYVGTDADGWGVFHADGTWTGRVIQVDGFSCDETRCIQPIGTVDPQGCAFDEDANLFGTDVGGGAVGVAEGALIVFFRQSGNPGQGLTHAYTDYCFVDRGLGAPGMPVVDDDGSIVVTEATTDQGPLRPAVDAFGQEDLRPLGAGAGRVVRYSFPLGTLTSLDCGADHELNAAGRAKVVKTEFMTFPADGMVTPESITRVPAGFEFGSTGTGDHYYVGSVLIPPVINEYDGAGRFVRNIVPPFVPKNPIGMGIASDGTLYYAELNLQPGVGAAGPTFDTGCGSVSRVRFASGVPLPPEELQGDLPFPDGVTVVSPRRLDVDLTALPLAPPPDGACRGE